MSESDIANGPIGTLHDDAAQPLAGCRVVDVSNWITGPLTAQMLTVLGAEVTKIEPLTGDPFRLWPTGGPSPRFATYNRGKRSLAVDLTRAQGRDLLARLYASADIVVAALRPDCLIPLGADVASVVAVNPSAIYCEISGFGPDAPAATSPGFETVVQATSGLFSTLTDPAAPVAVGPPILEHLTAQYAVQAILSARLDPASRRHLHISMLHAALALMGEPLTVWAASGAVFGARSRPAYSQAFAFTCADGQVIAMHLSSAEANWHALLSVAGDPPELADPVRFGGRSERVANFAEAQEIMQPIFAKRSSAAWLAELRAVGVPVAAANRIDQLTADPVIEALGVVRDSVPETSAGRTFSMVAPPGSRAGASEPAAPTIGEHSREILREAGFDAGEIDKLVDAGVVLSESGS